MSPNPRNDSISPSDQPNWMTIDYFNDIISTSYPNCKIRELTIKPASAKGDNFTAVLHRVILDIVDNEGNDICKKSYVVKSLPSNGDFQSEMMKDFNVFPKEIAVYDKIIPEFEKILKNSGVSTIFGPKCLKVSIYPNPTDIIVMEDLTEKNYKLAKRQDGLDMDHCKLLLEKIAQFHAASMIYREKHGPFKKPFDEGMYCERMRPMFEQAFEVNFKSRIDDLKKLSEHGAICAEIMEKWDKTKIFEYTLKVVTPSDEDNGLNVLIHGDLWTNNMMFAYDENNKVKDVILIDFQLSFWSSLAIDLNYFLISSTSQENRLKEFDNFIYIYHQHLEKYLKKLNYKKKIPTLIDIHVEVIKRGYYALMSALGVLPIVMLDPRDDANIENMISATEEGKKFKEALYNNPKYLEAMIELIPFFIRRGYFHID